MAELKTSRNDRSVEDFLGSIEDENKRRDSFQILEMMKKATQASPEMWGDSIVGFGSYRYRYASGREGEWFLTGFSPRKRNFTLYIMSGFDQYDRLLADLGKHSTGKSCLYVKKLEDVDLETLQALIEHSVAHMSETSA